MTTITNQSNSNLRLGIKLERCEMTQSNRVTVYANSQPPSPASTQAPEYSDTNPEPNDPGKYVMKHGAIETRYLSVEDRRKWLPRNTNLVQAVKPTTNSNSPIPRLEAHWYNIDTASRGTEVQYRLEDLDVE